VTRRNVNLGVSAGQQVAAFTIQDVQTLKLESSIDPGSFGRVAKGKPAQIFVDAFPGEVFKGRVDLVSPTVDSQTRRVPVEILIDNTSGRLLPHMFARAEVEAGKLQNVLTVPRESVLDVPAGAIVFRVRDGKVEQLKPVLGPADGAQVSIIEGLAEGDEIAVTGLGNLTDGASVKVAVTVSQND